MERLCRRVRRLRQERDDVEELAEVAWPAVAEDEGNSLRTSRAVVEEVDREILNFDSVVLEAVGRRNLSASLQGERSARGSLCTC